jgi:nucleotide-binding universal stress UspA family protein
VNVRLSTRTAPLEPLETPATGESGTVLLATFDVPFDEAAAGFAVDAAVDSGGALIVANVVELPPLPLSVIMGYDMLDYSPEMAASLLGPVQRAQALGVAVERIRVKSFRRTEALVEVAKERKIRMLVLGPDRQKVSPRLYKRAAGAVRDRLDCLVWISWEIALA